MKGRQVLFKNAGNCREILMKEYLFLKRARLPMPHPLLSHIHEAVVRLFNVAFFPSNPFSPRSGFRCSRATSLLPLSPRDFLHLSGRRAQPPLLLLRSYFSFHISLCFGADYC